MFGYDNDQEQVQRVLSGEKMSPRFWCCIKWHVWQRWEVVDEGTFKGNNDRYKELTRECKFCGDVQMKTVIDRRV